MKKLVLAITLLSLSFLTYSQGYWEEVQEVAPFGALNKCVFTDADNGWAVGQEGIIQHTSDGGLSWELQHVDYDMLFHSLSAINQNEAWVVGWSNILHTTDGGENWEEQIRPSCIGDLNDIFFLDENNGWIVGWYEIILKTIDGGETWEKISNQVSGVEIYNTVKFFDENNGILCGTKQNVGGIILITNDGGLSWTQTGPSPTSDFLSLDINNQGDVFVCGSDGKLFKSEDMGITWTDKSLDNNYFYDIEFGEDQTAYIIDHWNIYKTTDNCETWNVYNNVPYPVSLRDIDMGGEQLYGCGDRTAVYKISENADMETLLYNNPLNFRKIEFLNANEGFGIKGVSFIGQAVKTNDGGYTWYADTLIPEQEFYHLRSANQTLFYISKNNNLLKTSDGGQNWETIELNLDMSNWYIKDFSVPSENTLYICNDSSVLYKSVDGGYNWDQITFTEYHRFSISYFYDDNFGWLVDDYTGFLWRTADGGLSWTSMKVDPNHTYVPSGIYFIDENVGFVINEMGYVYRTSDGGDTFEKVFETEESLYPIFHFVNESTGYLINRGEILITEDGGLSWTEHQSLSGIAICAAFLNTNSWIAGTYELMAINDDLMDIQNITLSDFSLTVYPNPASDKIYLTNDNNIEVSSIDIISMDGKVCIENTRSINNSIDISQLNSGVYFLKCHTKQGIHVSRFIVK